MNESDAISRAKRVAEEHGWIWIDPPSALLLNCGAHNARWQIFSNGAGLGAKVRVELDDRTGEVIAQSFIPR